MVATKFLFPGGATKLKFSDLAPRPLRAVHQKSNLTSFTGRFIREIVPFAKIYLSKILGSLQLLINTCVRIAIL